MSLKRVTSVEIKDASWLDHSTGQKSVELSHLMCEAIRDFLQFYNSTDDAWVAVLFSKNQCLDSLID